MSIPTEEMSIPAAITVIQAAEWTNLVIVGAILIAYVPDWFYHTKKAAPC